MEYWFQSLRNAIFIAVGVKPTEKNQQQSSPIEAVCIDNYIPKTNLGMR